MFEDVPLDTRHHTCKAKPKFPKEWRMTEGRRKELANLRQQSLLLDEAKGAGGQLVDGVQRIRHALNPPDEAMREEMAAELISTPPSSRGFPPRPPQRL